MAQLHPLVSALLAVGVLAIIGYCAVTFTNAASFSLRQAEVASGTLSFSQDQLALRFETQHLSPRSAPPTVRITPKPDQAPRLLPPRSVQRHR